MTRPDWPSAPCGSSPLARGLLGARLRRGPAGRIIPARAGFTAGSAAAPAPRRDHPRSRGVYPFSAGVCSRRAGSSPLARGLPSASTSISRPRRIIPARAGFTTSSQPPSGPHQDHPRSRGVYTEAAAAAAGDGGSSPLARGLLSSRCASHTTGRIIPARAGFTTSSQPPSGPCQDHPRSRGVYHRRRCGLCPVIRIIPARAGFTYGALGGAVAAPDHPRSRGVYEWVDSPLPDALGSSPLARGLPDRRRLRPGCQRIIPARAGFTETACTSARSARDHPRSRGVYPSSLGKIRLAGVVLLHCLPNERSAELRKRLRRAAMDQVSLGGLTAPGMGDVPPFFFP